MRLVVRCAIALSTAILTFPASVGAQSVRATVIIPGFKGPILMDSVGQAIKVDAQASSGPLGDPIACETLGALEERMQKW